jgi:esterase/lipase superfamily enzyme
MFIITNRQVNEQLKTVDAFLDIPNANGPNELRMAEATRSGKQWAISILPDIITPAMIKEAGIVPDIDPKTNEEKPVFASRYVMHKIRGRVNPKLAGKRGKGRNLVLFIHGFNNNVQDVLDRAESFSRLYDVEVIAFTWPANGGGIKGVASYKSDKRDALASTGALDRALGKLNEYLQEIHAQHVTETEQEADERFGNDSEKWNSFVSNRSERWCPFNISLVLHSMGNYLYKHLLGSSTFNRDLLLFDNVILAAADTNNEDHAEWVDRIQFRKRLYITINENDAALLASRMKMGEQQKARLGHYLFRLDAQRAMYINFTGLPYVGDSHAYFKGRAVRNEAIKHFFHAVINGEHAETDLVYDVARNMYRFE